MRDLVNFTFKIALSHKIDWQTFFAYNTKQVGQDMYTYSLTHDTTKYFCVEPTKNYRDMSCTSAKSKVNSQ